MIESLQQYHPLVIEGMGGYDLRDPSDVAPLIVESLANHWRARPPSKPVLLITQGDPYEERGIAAITRRVADALNVSRGLIFLDPDIADYHAPNADRYKVIFDIAYSVLLGKLEMDRPSVARAIEQLVSAELKAKNAMRDGQNKPNLADYYYDFALLQEVTKIACKEICGDITIAHTSEQISPFSVTSFYCVGLELGLIDEADMVVYGACDAP